MTVCLSYTFSEFAFFHSFSRVVSRHPSSTIFFSYGESTPSILLTSDGPSFRTYDNAPVLSITQSEPQPTIACHLDKKERRWKHALITWLRGENKTWWDREKSAAPSFFRIWRHSHHRRSKGRAVVHATRI